VTVRMLWRPAGRATTVVLQAPHFSTTSDASGAASVITQERRKLFPHMLPPPCLLQYGLMPAIEIHMLRSVSVYTLVQGF